MTGAATWSCSAAAPQGESLTVDRRSFYNQLYAALTYASLVPLADEEGGGEEGEGGGHAEAPGGPQQQQQGEGPAPLEEQVGGQLGDGSCGLLGMTWAPMNLPVEGTFELHPPTFTLPPASPPPLPCSPAPAPPPQVCCLLPGLLEGMILDSKLLDVTRQAAFAKRIGAAAAAAGDTGTSMGLLCVLQRMLRCVGLSWAVQVCVRSGQGSVGSIVGTSCRLQIRPATDLTLG